MIQPHPKGSKASVLLSSVFGPYAQDDAYGSRAINPIVANTGVRIMPATSGGT